MPTAKLPFKSHFILFLGGFIGVLSLLPVVKQMLIMTQAELPLPIDVLQWLSLLQPTILLLLALVVGAKFAHRVDLRVPLLEPDSNICLRRQLFPAIIGGVISAVIIVLLSGMMMGSLPARFVEVGSALMPPWYSRILYGGITEELLLRWGVMSLLVWLSYKLLQGNEQPPKALHYWLGIVLSAVLFGAGHLPAAITLAGGLTPQLLLYIMLNNALFGLIAGLLFWRYGLGCAIGAHMICHATMLVAQMVIGGH